MQFIKHEITLDFIVKPRFDRRIETFIHVQMYVSSNIRT